MVCQIRILADWAFKKTFPLVISKCPQNDTTQNIASPNVAKCLQRFLVQLDEIAMTCYFHPFSEKYLTIFFFQVAFLSRSNCIHKQQSQFALFHARAYLLLLLLAFVCGWVCERVRLCKWVCKRVRVALGQYRKVSECVCVRERERERDQKDLQMRIFADPRHGAL